MATTLPLYQHHQTTETSIEFRLEISPFLGTINLLHLSFYRTKEGMNKRIFENCRSSHFIVLPIRVTRLGDLLDFGQLFKAYGNN